jgi:hypothetical protein
MFCPLNAKIQGEKVSLITEIDPKDYKPSILGAWWTNACMVVPKVGRVQRSELILGLSNKGGAHVDADIPENYRRLIARKSFFSLAHNSPFSLPTKI